MISSIEYAHYDGSSPIQDVIDYTNEHIEPYLNIHPKSQKVIMYDDIHSEISQPVFLKYMQELKNQPDCIYLESSFTPMMQKLYDDLEKQGYTYAQDDGKDYLRKDERRYNQFTTFLLRSESKNGKIFSCPALVATSYLYKLGYFNEVIMGLHDVELQKTEQEEILSILPSRYLQVETNARSIIELISPNYLKRLNYIFY